MAQYFFAGGTMPSAELLLFFNKHFTIEKMWKINGEHCGKSTARTYGQKHVQKWWNYWKIFFISCSEIFGFRNGNKRYVSHYLFSPLEK
ncbi:MAG: hypothetical protein ACOC44_12875 [Promethearchaeia archaeon]